MFPISAFALSSSTVAADPVATGSEANLPERVIIDHSEGISFDVESSGEVGVGSEESLSESLLATAASAASALSRYEGDSEFELPEEEEGLGSEEEDFEGEGEA